MSAEREKGLMPGLNEVFHFFFDDNDFDAEDIGRSLLNMQEVAAIAELKQLLDAILTAVGDAGDDAFVEHLAWSKVRQASAAARQCLQLAN